MTTDFSLRVYHPNKGNNPTILTKQVKDVQEYYNNPMPVYETTELRPYALYGHEAQPFGDTVRFKQITTPSYKSDTVEHYIGNCEEKGTARKVIYRKQPNTNNKTTIAIDYISDETARSKSYYRMNREYGQKVVELSRDLKDGDVFELLARQDKNGKVTADKLALKSGKVIENIPEYFQKLAKELDPLAKNWIRKVLKSLI